MHTPRECDDYDACTIDSCHQGACVHDEVHCDDGNLCTYDGCYPYSGCIYTPVNVSDGSVCTIDTCDPLTGAAAFTPIDCDDHESCTEDGCHYQTGCTHNSIHEGVSCDDPCIPDGICVQGTCTGTPVNCNDGNPCTRDSCHSSAGQSECSHENERNTPCDDGSVCTTHDICAYGSCVGGAATYGQGPGSPFGTGERPFAMAIADFDRDGRPDVAVVNEYSSNVTILLGDGFGGFSQAAGSPVGVGIYPVSIAVADFNRDGKVDLAVANSFDTMTVLLGDGSGGFVEGAGSPVPITGRPTSVVSGEFNGDGKADLAVASYDSGTVTVLLGNGSGAFTTAAGSPVGAGPSPYFLASGDVNGDTVPDLAVTNGVSPGTVTVLLGNGSGGFATAPGSPVPVGRYPGCVAMGDFDLDGHPDLAVTSDAVAILLGDGSGNFTQAAGSPLASVYPRSVAVVDFDLDGKLDVAVTNGMIPGDVRVLRGNGSAGFAEAPGSPVVLDANPNAIAVADLNLDGRPDMAVANYGSGNATILLNSSNVAPDGTVCSDGDDCTTGDACWAGVCVGGSDPGCDDGNPCTDDSCDPSSGCVHVPNDAPCEDGYTCTVGDHCSGGTCISGYPPCFPSFNPCYYERCIENFGCVIEFTTSPCDDGNTCTTGDRCSGVDFQCLGGPTTSCDDGNVCTDDSCDPSSGCINGCNNNCNVKGEGYWKKLCRDRDHQDDHSGEHYTPSDVDCVNDACTFSDVQTIDQMCGVLDPAHGHNDRCDKAERKFLSLLLNLCRCRLQPTQTIDTHCDPHHQTVAEVVSHEDTVLCNPSRTEEDCRHPECSTDEITNGQALWQNTLRLTKEGAAIRLAWSAVYGDPTGEAPRRYRIWRRPHGAGAPYTMLGEVNEHTFTFLDTVGGAGNFEYEVTATY